MVNFINKTLKDIFRNQEITFLKLRISELEAENRKLQEQIVITQTSNDPVMSDLSIKDKYKNALDGSFERENRLRNINSELELKLSFIKKCLQKILTLNINTPIADVFIMAQETLDQLDSLEKEV